MKSKNKNISLINSTYLLYRMSGKKSRNEEGIDKALSLSKEDMENSGIDQNDKHSGKGKSGRKSLPSVKKITKVKKT